MWIAIYIDSLKLATLRAMLPCPGQVPGIFYYGPLVTIMPPRRRLADAEFSLRSRSVVLVVLAVNQHLMFIPIVPFDRAPKPNAAFTVPVVSMLDAQTSSVDDPRSTCIVPLANAPLTVYAPWKSIIYR